MQKHFGISHLRKNEVRMYMNWPGNDPWKNSRATSCHDLLASSMRPKVLSISEVRLPGPLEMQFLLTFIDMNDESEWGQCSKIIEITTDSLTDNTLKRLLISVQRVNIMLCVKYAIQ